MCVLLCYECARSGSFACCVAPNHDASPTREDEASYFISLTNNVIMHTLLSTFIADKIYVTFY